MAWLWRKGITWANLRVLLPIAVASVLPLSLWPQRPCIPQPNICRGHLIHLLRLRFLLDIQVGKSWRQSDMRAHLGLWGEIHEHLGLVSLWLRADEITHREYRGAAWELNPVALHISEPGGMRKNQWGDWEGAAFGGTGKLCCLSFTDWSFSEKAGIHRFKTEDWTLIDPDSNLSHLLNIKWVYTSLYYWVQFGRPAKGILCEKKSNKGLGLRELGIQEEGSSPWRWFSMTSQHDKSFNESVSHALGEWRGVVNPACNGLT